MKELGMAEHKDLIQAVVRLTCELRHTNKHLDEISDLGNSFYQELMMGSFESSLEELTGVLRWLCQLIEAGKGGAPGIIGKQFDSIKSDGGKE
jgi:hypothetical protein